MDRDKAMLNGYLEGYRDGFCDAVNGKADISAQNDVLALPIKVVPLSARARNCLTAAGCVSVKDVADLEEGKIARIRNLGVKTGKEIAMYLVENGIYESAWNDYI